MVRWVEVEVFRRVWCFFGIIKMYVGNGFNYMLSRIIYWNGIRVGSSFYIINEINICYFNDVGLVCFRWKSVNWSL